MDLGGEGRASIIVGLTARPAGSAKREAGLTLLDALCDDQQPVRTVLSDRGYTYLGHENWADPLMDRGIEQVLDLHTNQRTVHPGPLPGTIWVDGGLFAAALPERLRRLPGFSLGLTSTEQADLCALYDERDVYAFKPMGHPNLARRTQRLRGPARDGRLRCPNHPASMRRSPATHPTTTCAPGACSCASTPTVGPEDMTQLRQRERFGTTAWKRSYGRRSAIESANASLKTHHSHAARGGVRVMGVRRTALLVALIIAAANIRILLDCYGFDPSTPHPEDIEVRPLPSISSAQHRKPRLFQRRSRSGSPPTRPRNDHGSWGLYSDTTH